MKKRVLLISYYFAPQNTIGAVRPTKLAKYLERMGYEVTVLCSHGLSAQVDPTLQRDLEQLKDVRFIREWNPIYRRAEKRAQGFDNTNQVKPSAGEQARANPSFLARVKKLVSGIIDWVYLYCFWLADMDFGRKAKREIRQLEGQYDYVMSSYATYSVHLAGCYAKKCGKAKKWVADFRDEVNMFFPWHNRLKKGYVEQVRNHADLITAVSRGVLDMMDLGQIGRVLPNGFDREDLPQGSETEAKEENTLRVTYCGYISEGRKDTPHRDLSPMMRILSRLIDRGALTREQLRLVYAGGQSELFVQVATASGLETCVEDHGFISRQESLRLQRSTDILLMASRHEVGREGILTGKLFEYMMMDRPVTCCMSGNLTGSDVKQVLESTGIGFCCEQAAGQADEDALLDYVQVIMERKKKQQPLLETSQMEAINAYSYPHLAAKLADWIEA